MTRREDLIAELESDGMSVTEWADDAGAHYPSHSHPRDEVLVILHGEIAMSIAGGERRLCAGDRLELRAGEVHTATVGPDGARYLVGRR